MKHLRNCKNYSTPDTEKQDMKLRHQLKALEATLRNWTLFQNAIETEADLCEDHRCTFTKVSISLLHALLERQSRRGRCEEITGEMNSTSETLEYT